jgi:hypothetical protein
MLSLSCAQVANKELDSENEKIGVRKEDLEVKLKPTRFPVPTCCSG